LVDKSSAATVGFPVTDFCWFCVTASLWHDVLGVLLIAVVCHYHITTTLSDLTDATNHHKHWNIGYSLVRLLIDNDYKSSAQLIRQSICWQSIGCSWCCRLDALSSDIVTAGRARRLSAGKLQGPVLSHAA